jgi:hypothetical protein
LPKKPEVTKLGKSYRVALTRFGYLEHKVSRNEDLKTQYCAFIDPYIRLGHMAPALASPPSSSTTET